MLRKKIGWAFLPVFAIATIFSLSAFVGTGESEPEAAKKKASVLYCYNNKEELVHTGEECEKGKGNCVADPCPLNTHTHP